MHTIKDDGNILSLSATIQFKIIDMIKNNTVCNFSDNNNYEWLKLSLVSKTFLQIVQKQYNYYNIKDIDEFNKIVIKENGYKSDLFLMKYVNMIYYKLPKIKNKYSSNGDNQPLDKNKEKLVQLFSSTYWAEWNEETPKYFHLTAANHLGTELSDCRYITHLKIIYPLSLATSSIPFPPCLKYLYLHADLSNGASNHDCFTRLMDTLTQIERPQLQTLHLYSLANSQFFFSNDIVHSLNSFSRSFRNLEEFSFSISTLDNPKFELAFIDFLQRQTTLRKIIFNTPPKIPFMTQDNKIKNRDTNKLVEYIFSKESHLDDISISLDSDKIPTFGKRLSKLTLTLNYCMSGPELTDIDNIKSQANHALEQFKKVDTLSILSNGNCKQYFDLIFKRQK